MEAASGSFLPSREAARKYLSLATDTTVNNCLSKYENSEITELKIDDFELNDTSQQLRFSHEFLGGE